MLLFWLIAMYRIYPKYSDTSTPYHICYKIWTSTIHYPMLCLKIAGWVANSVDPDETQRSAASHLGLYWMLRHVCPNTYGKYGMSQLFTCFIYIIFLFLRWLGILGRFSAILFKGDNFYDLFASLYTSPLLKGVYSKRKEFAPEGSKFFAFRVDPIRREEKFWIVSLESINFTYCFFVEL